MSYIGAQPTTAAFVTDQFSGDDSTTVFTMSVAPANSASVIVAVSGVLQDPSTYAVSGTTLTFSGAPPTGAGNISARYLGLYVSGVVESIPALPGAVLTSYLATLSGIIEKNSTTATAATGVINYDVETQSVLSYTADATGNWTVNFRGSGVTSLDTYLETGESVSVTFLVTQGSTAYYNSAVTIDGASVTPKWQGGSAPTSGNASSVDCYTYVIQKTGAATYVVLASQTQFA
jgi:hypothetical protein